MKSRTTVRPGRTAVWSMVFGWAAGLGVLAACDDGVGSLEDMTVPVENEQGSLVLPLLPEPVVPTPMGTCPDLSASGWVDVRVPGLPARRAHVWRGEGPIHGPVVFYWYGTNSNTDEAFWGIGPDNFLDILDEGGLIIAFEHDPGAGDFPWHLVMSEDDDDLRVADELLGCAEQQLDVDDERIHAMGFSAGGLHATQMAFRRSQYIASVVSYSGGMLFPPGPEDVPAPDNPVHMLAFHGGSGDEVIVNFESLSNDLSDYVSSYGRSGFVCDHGGGHARPGANGQALAWSFLQDHPWGQRESAWASAAHQLPAHCN